MNGAPSGILRHSTRNFYNRVRKASLRSSEPQGLSAINVKKQFLSRNKFELETVWCTFRDSNPGPTD